MVTGKTKTSAIQLDLSSGKIMDTTGAHFDEFTGYKYSLDDAEGEGYFHDYDENSAEPIWLILKNYDYLSYSKDKGFEGSSVFYSEFS